jgi:hypothetical protein
VTGVFGIDQPQADRHPVAAPTSYQQHQLEAEDIAGVLIHPGLVSQGMLLAPLALQGLIPTQIQHPVGGRGQQGEGDLGHVSD